MANNKSEKILCDMCEGINIIDFSVVEVCNHEDCKSAYCGWKPPKCAEKGCNNFAAKNEYFPNSEGGEYWEYCEKCYEKDQEEE